MTEDVLVNNHFHYFGENGGDRNRSVIGDLNEIERERERECYVNITTCCLDPILTIT